MVGLGEEGTSSSRCSATCAASGWTILTIGQYLRPTDVASADDALLHAGRVRRAEAHRARPRLRPRRSGTARPQFLSRARAGRHPCRRACGCRYLAAHRRAYQRPPAAARARASSPATAARGCAATASTSRRRSAPPSATRRTGDVRSLASATRCARLLVVGLAPAAHGANRTGRVFTGDGVRVRRLPDAGHDGGRLRQQPVARHSTTAWAHATRSSPRRSGVRRPTTRRRQPRSRVARRTYWPSGTPSRTCARCSASASWRGTPAGARWRGADTRSHARARPLRTSRASSFPTASRSSAPTTPAGRTPIRVA